MKLDIRHEDLRDLIATRLNALPEDTSTVQSEAAATKSAVIEDENLDLSEVISDDEDQPTTLAKEA